MRRLGSKGRARLARLAAVRPTVLARAGGRCENPWCRKAARLDLHHVAKRSQGGTDGPENLVAVCRRCHDLLTVPPGTGPLGVLPPMRGAFAWSLIVDGRLAVARTLVLPAGQGAD